MFHLFSFAKKNVDSHDRNTFIRKGFPDRLVLLITHDKRLAVVLRGRSFALHDLHPPSSRRDRIQQRVLDVRYQLVRLSYRHQRDHEPARKRRNWIRTSRNVVPLNNPPSSLTSFALPIASFNLNPSFASFAGSRNRCSSPGSRISSAAIHASTQASDTTAGAELIACKNLDVRFRESASKY
jgi:hypothetical protein